MATETERYSESESHVPNPTDVYGTVDTSGTGGIAHGKIETVTPIFEVAKAQDLDYAARALDPDDDSADASLVTLPGDLRTREEAIDIVKGNKDPEPVELGGPNFAQKAAAEEGSASEAVAQGAAGTAGDGRNNDTGKDHEDSGAKSPFVTP